MNRDGARIRGSARCQVRSASRPSTAPSAETARLPFMHDRRSGATTLPACEAPTHAVQMRPVESSKSVWFAQISLNSWAVSTVGTPAFAAASTTAGVSW